MNNYYIHKGLSPKHLGMSKGTNHKRSESTFEVGDVIFLRLQPYKQTIVSFKGNKKLSPRFFGPMIIQQDWTSCLQIRVSS